MTKPSRSTIALLSVIFLMPFSSQAQHAWSCHQDAVAFGGYDLVSYFQSGPKKGSADITSEFEDLIFYFSSVANKTTFEGNPTKYVPKYGGWCATAMAAGNFVQPDYSLYEIKDGELLFFEVKAFYNGQTHWQKDPDKNEILADRNYRINLEELPEKQQFR